MIASIFVAAAGRIPTELGTLTRLTLIDLGFNKLTGGYYIHNRSDTRIGTSTWDRIEFFVRFWFYSLADHNLHGPNNPMTQLTALSQCT